MSKQSDAKESQKYVCKANTCATCANLSEKRALNGMQLRQNSAMANPIFIAQRDGLIRRKCSVGGFAVRANGYCDVYKKRGKQ